MRTGPARSGRPDDRLRMVEGATGLSDCCRRGSINLCSLRRGPRPSHHPTRLARLDGPPSPLSRSGMKLSERNRHVSNHACGRPPAGRRRDFCAGSAMATFRRHISIDMMSPFQLWRMRISLSEGRLRPRVLPKAERVRCPRAGGYGPFPGGLGIIPPALGPAREVLHWTGTGAARVTPVERRALLARKGGQRIVRSGRVPGSMA